MRNNIILVICVLFLSLTAGAQINLVLNPQLEQYSVCPSTLDMATYCTHWNTLDSAWRAPDWTHDLNGVPEYCNACAPLGSVSVPASDYFYQYPHSGNGMMQVMMYSDDVDTTYVRDYLQGHLAQTLVAGHKYNVRFYTNLEESGGYAISGIGAYLDNGTIDTTHFPYRPQIQYAPQIIDTSIIRDTLNWIQIEDTFTATGTEKLITIGNFHDRAHTNKVSVPWGTATSWAWYLIDDVSVIDCSNVPFAGHDTVIHTPDSVFIGSHEALLPYTWYKYGSTTPIDSGGGIWVKPTITTRYILEQKLCGITKMDTVKIWVWPDTPSMVNDKWLMVNFQVYPNPTSKELTIEGAKNCEVVFYDVVGKKIASFLAMTEKEVIDVLGLEKGIYLVQVVDDATGEKIIRKVIKE